MTRVPWTLAENPKPRSGPTVLSTFSCGGGSSMGYRLAGCRVVGAVEVDPRMAAVYRKNLKGKVYNEKIQDFRVSDAAEEYVGVDILDGSPPCTLFSLTRRGGRSKSEELWKKDVALREGGVSQRVNDLFFEFIDLAERLRPKVVIAENVKGMVIGSAKGYAKMVLQRLREIGYRPQLFLLNACRMGVPQTRQRVFFLASRDDLDLPPIELNFAEPPISVAEAIKGAGGEKKLIREGKGVRLKWEGGRVGQNLGQAASGRDSYLFNWIILDPHQPCNTIITSAQLCHWAEPRVLNLQELVRCQSFPDDYDFAGTDGRFVVGMSVPPLMMERIAHQVREQWIG